MKLIKFLLILCLLSSYSASGVDRKTAPSPHHNCSNIDSKTDQLVELKNVIAFDFLPIDHDATYLSWVSNRYIFRYSVYM